MIRRTPLKRTGINRKPMNAKQRAYADFMLQFRDKRCAICGTTRGTVGHHLRKRSTHPALRMDRANVMPLCLRHHAIAHDDRDFNAFLITNREKGLL